MRAAGELIGRCVDIPAVLALAASAPRMSCAPWDPHLAIGPTPRHHGGLRPRIAVAGGPAFTFSYAEHTELLRAAGADIVVVDPCRDEALPPRTTALVLGGGFPELYAKALSDNELLRKDVADLARLGFPLAEVSEDGRQLYATVVGTDVNGRAVSRLVAIGRSINICERFMQPLWRELSFYR